MRVKASDHALVAKMEREVPKRPDEEDFAYIARLTERLPPETKHRLIAVARERTKPVKFLADAAKQWRKEYHIPEPKANLLKQIASLEKAHKIVAAVDSMESDPDNKEWRAAFADFMYQTSQMWDLLTKDLGVNVEVWDERDKGKADPYHNAQEQADDLENNRHLWINRGNFFVGAEEGKTPKYSHGTDHPFMNEEQYFKFRAVHDAFGHAAIGSSFDRHGEYEAWLAHNAMYTGHGRKAMSTEYHVVNSYLWSTGRPMPHSKMGIILPDELIENVYDVNGNIVRLASAEADLTALSMKDADVTDEQLKAFAEHFGITPDMVNKLDNAWQTTGSTHVIGYKPVSLEKKKSNAELTLEKAAKK